jgi:hypothetical protein
VTNLVDRYVDEATSRVGASTRDEVRRDIHGMVDELVEARMAQGEPPDAATEQVLNELGNPQRLARQYDGEHRYLVGPRHYDDYVRLLMAICWSVLPLIAIVIFGANMLEGDGTIGGLVGGAIVDALWTTFIVGVQIAFWVTVAFVVMERTEGGATAEVASDRDEWTVVDLPPVVPKRQISMADALVGLGFTVFIGAILVLLYRNGISMYLGDEASASIDGFVPFFNPEIPASVAWLVLGLLVADALLDVTKYAVGYWTRFVSFTQVALNVVWIVVGLLVLRAWDLVNPGIRGSVDEGLADFFLADWFEQAVLAVVLVTAAIAIWEAVRGYLAWRPADDPWSV